MKIEQEFEIDSHGEHFEEWWTVRDDEGGLVCKCETHEMASWIVEAIDAWMLENFKFGKVL